MNTLSNMYESKHGFIKKAYVIQYLKWKSTLPHLGVNLLMQHITEAEWSEVITSPLLSLTEYAKYTI